MSMIQVCVGVYCVYIIHEVTYTYTKIITSVLHYKNRYAVCMSFLYYNIEKKMNFTRTD